MRLSSLIWFLVSFSSFFGRSLASDSESGSREPDYDYEIYELIDRMNKLTPAYSTFYELLQVTPSSSNDEVSRQFRRLAFQYHPDKNSDSKAHALFKLYSGAAHVLKDEAQRARYEWILNEASPWHRSQVYMMHKLHRRRQRKSDGEFVPEISLYGILVFIVVALTATQLIVQWSRFAVNRYWIWSGNRGLKSIPAKEMRRMERKAMKNDLTYLAYLDSNFETMAAARTQPLAIPQPTDLFILALPLAIVNLIISTIFKRTPKEVQKNE